MGKVDFERVQYSYPDSKAPALASLDLEIGPGEMYLLAGKSGSGKSTVLRAASGLVPRFFGGYFSGRVRVADMDTRLHSTLELAAHVGMVFQEPESRFLTRRAEDEIALGMEFAGVPSGTIGRRLGEIAERLDLGPLLNRPLDTLSAGEQQRVAVAAALGREPSILLLDEPTSQLDGTAAEEVVNWVTRLGRESGLTALIAESRLGRCAQLAQRVGYLDEGCLAGEGRPEEVIPELPIAPPLTQAARDLGIHRRPGVGAELRRRLIGLKDTPRASDTAGPIRLQASGLHFRFNGSPALDGVDLDVRIGETVALVGRNGSGKTTLLRCLVGLLTPQAGRVEMDRQSILGLPVFQRAQRLGYVPQWPGSLLFAHDLRQELAITLRNLGRDAHPPLDPEELLARFGLHEVAGRYPRDLSAGQRQRAALASIVVAGPDVLLLDEPTLGMDILAQEQFGSLLADLRSGGTAIVVATHDLEFAARNAQRCVVLERGQVVAEGLTAETLFARRETQTALQRLTGQARPASPSDLGDLRRASGM